jgi:hypothetical protein
VTDVLEVVSWLEESGGRLVLDGDRIRYSVPKGNGEVQAFLADLRKRRSEVASLLRARAEILTMPTGVRVVAWNLKPPPVAIESFAVVFDTGLFACSTLEQLRVILANPKRWPGWSVPQLIDRLAQVGARVTLESAGSDRVGG